PPRFRPFRATRLGDELASDISQVRSTSFHGVTQPTLTQPISNPFSTRWVKPGTLSYCFEPGRTLQDGDRFVDQFIDQLRSCRGGLIVGPHGSGKSTLLQSLSPHLQEAFADLRVIRTHAVSQTGWAAGLAHQRRTFHLVGDQQSQLACGGLLVIDGLEQLTDWNRRRVLRTARRRGHCVLGTSHRHLHSFTMLYRTRITPELIKHLTALLLANSPPPIAARIGDELQRQDLNGLSDLRQLWFEFYDVVESCREPCSDLTLDYD
ncbi:MAG: ATP-binding protein, partial [Pirellulales bacterium]|nr:ATP-binding protein [Pirellulales bacterium]